MSGKSSREGVSFQDGDKQYQVVKEVREAALIPPAAELERYEKIHPGMAERMLSMAEKQQEHRLQQGDVKTTRNYNLAVFGQLICAFLCLCGIGLAAAGLIFKYQYAVGFGIVSVVGIIAVGAISRNK